MNSIFIYIQKNKVYVAIVLLLTLSIPAFSKSDFRVVYQIDNEIISNYDIDQAKKLRNLLGDTNLSNNRVEKIVVNEKIKELYASRIRIEASDADLKAQIDNFLLSNKMNIKELKSLLNSKGIDIETFYNFVKANIRWQKVLDNRFGYKISNLAMKDVLPLAPSPKRIEKEYEFSEIFISYRRWSPEKAGLIASRLGIELKAGADFGKAAKKFSSAESKNNKGKVGPIKKSNIPKQLRDVLDQLKRNEISTPIKIEGGLLLLKLNRTRSYKTTKTPKLTVTFAVSNTGSQNGTGCSDEKDIRGPVLLTKVEKKIRDILVKLMPGESYKFSDNNGVMRLVTLCESVISEKQSQRLNFENIMKNEEAERLSNALILELRRNSTIVKK